MASGNQGRPGDKPGRATPAKSAKPAAKAAPKPKKATGATKSTTATGATKSTKAAGASKSTGASRSTRAAAGAAGATGRAGSGGGSRAGASRTERLEAARRQRQRRSVWLRLGVAGAALLVVAVVLFTANRSDSVVSRLEAGPGDCAYDTEFDGTARTQSDHIDGPTYTVDPPAGGAHEPTAAAPGFYEAGDVPSDGKLVHAMEHGFVVLWHRPDVSDATREEIEALSDRFGRELIVAPRASLSAEVAVTAWHRRLLCQQLDPDAVALFTNSYKDKGPETGFL
ncbi:MAG TPA: DUF3105 domain-containing protein [Acidimicrobiales bacterium]|nr:DUF3105 domain-containing protein [Acidimicrobiales bacterium]